MPSSSKHNDMGDVVIDLTTEQSIKDSIAMCGQSGNALLASLSTKLSLNFSFNFTENKGYGTLPEV
jgi:hypothetical protein